MLHSPTVHIVMLGGQWAIHSRATGAILIYMRVLGGGPHCALQLGFH